MKDIMAAEPLDVTIEIDGKELEDKATGSSEDDLDSIATNDLLWADMLQFDFRKTFKVSQLNRLRSFLKKGVTFNVVAVKHSYVPKDPKLSEEQSKEDSASEKQGVKTNASKDLTKLDAKDGKKSGKTKSATKLAMGKEKGGKKDKRDVSEMFELPQERKTVGTCHVLLTSFLDGETLVNVNSPCIEENGETEDESIRNDHSIAEGSKSQCGKRSDDKKKGKGVRGTLTCPTAALYRPC